MPHLVILAGPNGAGKSTAAASVLQGTLAVDQFVNADVIARGLSEFHPESVSLEAGRIMLQRLRDLTGQGRNVAFETTLASRTFAVWIRELKTSGYRFVLEFLCLPDPDTAVQRVCHRVRLRGHHVPEDVIRRRHAAGLRNFFDLYAPLANQWSLYNNSQDTRALVAAGCGTAVTRIDDPVFWDNLVKAYATNRFTGGN